MEKLATRHYIHLDVMPHVHDCDVAVAPNRNPSLAPKQKIPFISPQIKNPRTAAGSFFRIREGRVVR